MWVDVDRIVRDHKRHATLCDCQEFRVMLPGPRLFKYGSMDLDYYAMEGVCDVWKYCAETETIACFSGDPGQCPL